MKVLNDVWSRVAAILALIVTLAFVGVLLIQTEHEQSTAQDTTKANLMPSPFATNQLIPTPSDTYSPPAWTGEPSTSQPVHSAVAYATDVPRNYPEPTPELIQQAAFDSWRYDAFKDRRGNPFATISYNTDSVAAISRYASDNRELAQQLLTKNEPIEVYVTFRNYVAPDKFGTWFSTSGITNSLTIHAAATMRMIRQAGDRITSGIGLDGSTEPVVAQWPGAKVKGAYLVHGWVDSNHLSALLNDSLVFLVDVTPNIVRNELSKNGVDLSKARIQVLPNSPFWMMEDAGLDNFRQ